jgi:hypothetical protein
VQTHNPPPSTSATRPPPGGSTADVPMHPYDTRLKHNIRQPNKRTDGTVTHSMVRSPTAKPTSYVVAMKNPL